MDGASEEPSGLEVRRLDESLRADFDRLMDGDPGCSWCRCVAWWVPTWDGWGERSAEQNRALREELWARGEDDGFLAFRGETAVGWCQAGLRDRLQKLAAAMDLEPDAEAWAITCFYVPAGERRTGIARALLRGVLRELNARGVPRVEAFPRSGEQLECGELWTGPEKLFLESGFRATARRSNRIVMVRELGGG